MAGMRIVLPDAVVEDLKNEDEICHVLDDIKENSRSRAGSTSTLAEPVTTNA